jgi:hypothetical protein
MRAKSSGFGSSAHESASVPMGRRRTGYQKQIVGPTSTRIGSLQAFPTVPDRPFPKGMMSPVAEDGKARFPKGSLLAVIVGCEMPKWPQDTHARVVSRTWDARLLDIGIFHWTRGRYPCSGGMTLTKIASDTRELIAHSPRGAFRRQQQSAVRLEKLLETTARGMREAQFVFVAGFLHGYSYSLVGSRITSRATTSD